ncbi:hypothetical protein CC2G_014445 [Coprinopsis cinerea AmutBmut pab1-1]|nr:hypothetical protein CC2G_014445 [Coprinopsis cinerea AmutBmut pab1-1]
MSESARNIDRWYTAVGLQANSSMAIPVAAVEVFMCIHGLNLFMNMSSIRRKGLTLYMVVASVLTVISCINAVTSGIFSFRIFLDTSQSLDNVNEALHSHDNSVVDHIVSFTLIGQRWIGDALLVYRCFVIWHDHLWVAIAPVFVFLISLGVSIRTFIPIHNWEYNNYIAISVDIFISLALHIVVTFLIVYRLMSFRSRLLKIFPLASGGDSDGVIVYTH